LQVVTIAITGTNDSPVANESTSTTTAIYTDTGPDTLTGQLAADDPDDFVNAPTWAINVAPEESGNVYGSMSIDADTGLWTYTVDTAVAGALGVGSTARENYVATVVDEFGASSSIFVRIDITGTNQAPVITFNNSFFPNVQEPGVGTPGTLLARDGSLQYTDVDEGETVGAWSIVETNPAAFGSATIDALTGEWTYTLDAGLADSIGGGQFETDTFDVIYTDALGAESNTLEIPVTITGSNDAATFSGDLSGAITENAVSESGTALNEDVDNNNTDGAFQVVTNTASTGGYGTFSIDALGSWTYVLDNADPVVNGLATGATLNDSFTVQSVDGTPQVIAIVITGANDAPTVADFSRTITEDTIVITQT
jgi:VCBS repeat-containing protein